MIRVSNVLRARSSSSAAGPSVRNFWSSASIAVSSSAAVCPVRAVAEIVKTEPSSREYWLALTSWAICCS